MAATSSPHGDDTNGATDGLTTLHTLYQNSRHSAHARDTLTELADTLDDRLTHQPLTNITLTGGHIITVTALLHDLATHTRGDLDDTALDNDTWMARNRIRSNTYNRISLHAIAPADTGISPHTSPTPADRIGLRNLHALIRWRHLALHHPAVDAYCTWTEHWERHTLYGATPATLAATYITVHRTAGAHLRTLEQRHPTHILSFAEQLAADDTHCHHTIRTLINTAAALTP
jgi:hypothetical protein